MSSDAPQNSPQGSTSAPQPRAAQADDFAQQQREALDREVKRGRFGLWIALMIIVVGGGYLILANPIESGNVLRIGVPLEAQTLDPHAATDIDSGRINQLIYEGLVDFIRGEDAVAKDPVPALAKDWHLSEDRLSYTFELREGVRFHDGAALDAEAVKMSLDRARGADDSYYGPTLVTPPYQSNYRDIEEVEVVDELTVRIHVRQPNVTLLRNLAMTTAAILSPDYLRGLGAGESPSPAGTGPLRFHSWHRGQVITLARNDNYWGAEEHGTVEFDRVLFRYVDDPQQRLNELRTGRLDIAVDIRPEHATQVEEHPQIVKRPIEVPNVCYFVLNPNEEIPRLRTDETRENPLAPQWVREAIALAIDQEQIVERVYRGLAIPAHSMLSPLIPGHPEDYERAPLDQRRDQARALLAENGYDEDNPLEITMNLFPEPRAYIPDTRRLGEVVQLQLEEIGIKVRLDPEPWEQYLSNCKTGAYPFMVIGWQTVSGDADYTFSPLFGVDDNGNPTELNMPKWVDEEFQQMVEEARAEFDREARIQRYQEIEARLREARVTLPVAHYTPIWGVRNHVENFGVSPVGRLLLEQTSIVH